MQITKLISIYCLLFSTVVVSAFTTNSVVYNQNTSSSTSPSQPKNRMPTTTIAMADATAATGTSDGTVDDDRSKSSIAKYLVNLHDAKETFDFCGGMMFQLVLTDALRNHLLNLKNNEDVTVYENTPRMHMTPNYSQTSHADNIQYFHGREIRQVPNAAGGMGMVLQLSLANGNDPEGWTTAEQERYDGWGHDSGREWRRGTQLVQEGFATFQDKFGPQAFALHHRFYLHRDVFGRLWLAAEDGCEGTPKPAKNLSNLFGLLK